MTGTSDTTHGSRDPLSQARDDAKAAVSGVKTGLGEFAQEAGTKASGIAGEATEMAGEIFRTASDRATDLADEGKRIGADHVSGIASAINKAADDLEASSPDIARHVRTAAGSFDGISSALRDRSAGQLLEDLTGFAKRQPAGFFALAAVTGFAIARFAKSSTAHQAPGSSHVDQGAPSAPGWTQHQADTPAQPATMAAASLGGAAAHRMGSGLPGTMTTAPTDRPALPSYGSPGDGGLGSSPAPTSPDQRTVPL